MKILTKALALGAIMVSCNGCVLLAAGGAGYMTHDEATEGDGKFDPLEEHIDYDDDDND